MKKCAAFFDLDGTISREGLISQMFRKMIKYELIDDARWHEEVEPAFIKWNRRLGGYDEYLLKMVEIYAEAARNIEQFHIEYIARRVVEQSGERVYTYSRERIKWHRDQGHLVIAISGSPVELVCEMACKYEMDDYRGTIYEVGANGIYTGEVIPMWDSASKSRAILEMAEKHDIDLAKSYAYGDTAGDIAMLKHVAHPFAINPTRELITKILGDAELAERIAIIIERKDVTYQLDATTVKLIDSSSD